MIKNKRNQEVDVFRCLLMFFIVAHHAFIRGAWSYVPEMWTLPFLCLIAWHVPGFISISGWFGVKFSWRKFFALIGLMAFYSIPNVLGGDMRITGGWFGASYLALMLMSPIVNAGIDTLVFESRRGAWVAWSLFAIVIVANWIPFGERLPLAMKGVDQFSLVNMIFIYVTARLVRLTVSKPIGGCVLALGPIAFFSSVCAIGLFKTFVSHGRGLPTNPADWTWLSYYTAPHVWVMAISVLLFFVWHVRLPAIIGRIFSFLAPSMFGVYLLHEGCSYGQCVFEPFQLRLQELLGCHPALSVLLSALAVFAGCVAVDLARRGVLRIAKEIFAQGKSENAICG